MKRHNAQAHYSTVAQWLCDDDDDNYNNNNNNNNNNMF